MFNSYLGTGAGTGILLQNVTGTSTVDNNTVTDFVDGITLDASNATVDNNQLVNNTGNGISAINGSNNNVISNNTITGSNIGINIADSNNVQLASNVVIGDGTSIGVLMTNTEGNSITGGQLLGHLVGIELNDATGTTIDGVSSIANGTHILARNGSTVTVGNTQLIGGVIGVLLTDPGTVFTFTGNGSSFTGMGAYFVLLNQAMAGQTLDASQQVFDGTRASDFTFAQLLAAEAKTLDFDDNVTVGNVFYKNFFNLNLLNQFLRDRSGLFDGALFSYAGQTITTSPSQTQTNFSIRDINLSLLGQGGNGVGGGNNPANLANLSPAAGGNADQVANLSPSAGGDADCGNGFLAGGALGGACGAGGALNQ